ncbi:phosphodiester glycosidase family protein [Candidatus Gottesmanbacteria bacterium]|nr:phosphodiester glycosidase family protein [Candidatus Gottesmanbacteria bacterium]
MNTFRTFFHFRIVGALLAGLVIVFVGWQGWQMNQNLQQEQLVLRKQTEQLSQELSDLKHQDQYVINQKLEEEIGSIQKTYGDAVGSYEELLLWKPYAKDTSKLDELFADALAMLAKRNYASASAVIAALRTGIREERAKNAAVSSVPANVAVNNAAPASGYSRQRVDTDAGSFLVDIIAGDLSSTRVIVDTASDGTCTKDCPVTSLGDYVSRSGAYAGVNGSYFCPAEYPSCTDKKNSFDTLLMNKNKVYFNSDNNVYSTVPAVIFLGGSVRFVGQSLEWGRDTGVDGVIANRPALVMGGNIVFSGEGEPKEGNRGNRSFVANKGNVVYIGVVHGASVAESAKVMKALGMDNALNLDNGGSTALWSGGYRVGPGRNIPNAILFVRK